jgi:hypothetical protein
LFIIRHRAQEGANRTGDTTLNLDELEISESDRQWDPFYRVRARLIDGQTAIYHPARTAAPGRQGNTLTGAALFFSNGCYAAGDKIAVKSMFLLTYPWSG